MVQVDQTQAKIIMERMIEHLHHAIAPFNTRVTFSIGVVIYLADKPSNIDELLKIADSAMYSIKKSTKNAVSYTIA
jgi:diguanylate cyclase (GGDEF)-like protein